jgi:hypothetical protein
VRWAVVCGATLQAFVKAAGGQGDLAVGGKGGGAKKRKKEQNGGGGGVGGAPVVGTLELAASAPAVQPS